jgi:DNA modification methylase
VWDVLADDGTLWLNIGDSYYNYRPGIGQRQGKQSIAGQKFSEVENCPKRGMKLDGIKEKDLIGIPWMLAFALRADGWYLRQDIIWHKPNPMPESVKDRCTKAHEYIFLLSKKERYFFDHEAIMEPVAVSTIERLSQRTLEQQVGSSRVPGKTNGNMKAVGNSETRNRRSVWTVTTKPYSGAHFATFPLDLIEPCILAGAPVGGVVLDPFMGSGTTAAVAIKHKRKYLGCELNPEYKPLQDERIKQAEMEIAQMELL